MWILYILVWPGFLQEIEPTAMCLTLHNKRITPVFSSHYTECILWPYQHLFQAMPLLSPLFPYSFLFCDGFCLVFEDGITPATPTFLLGPSLCCIGQLCCLPISLSFQMSCTISFATHLPLHQSGNTIKMLTEMLIQDTSFPTPLQKKIQCKCQPPDTAIHSSAFNMRNKFCLSLPRC